MHRFVTIASCVALSLCVLSGCSGGPDPAPGNKEGTKQPSASGDPPSTDGNDTKDAEGNKLGPDCKAYIACCDELAASQPAFAGSCDQTKKTIADATDKGASTSQYEASCKQALAAAQSAGYCE